MMKEVLAGPENGGSDFAVADLSITGVRAKAVTFSMPWMNLGNTSVMITMMILIDIGDDSVDDLDDDGSSGGAGERRL